VRNVRSRPDAPAVPGIIETLTMGFEVVNRMPWVLALPVTVDLLLWLGPKLSIAALSERLAERVLAMVGDAGGAAGSTAEGQIGQLVQQIDVLRGIARSLNLLSLLAPGGFAMASAVPAERGGLGGQVELGSASLVVVIGTGLLLLGVGLACLWLGAIAQQLRDGEISAPRLLWAVPRYWLSIIGFFALLIGGALAVSLPLMAVATVTQLFVPALGTFLTLFVAVALQLLLIWALLYLSFFADAIVVSEVGPIRAATSSVRVVSSNFWSALGFIIITWVIMRGLYEIWQGLAQAPVGLALAIFGNGYVESGLAAASMLFYRNRIARSTS
jgi:hypothetical protein